ncbi:hypothetical protein CLM62_08005 [Streptomyces sp. SA15]|nr:hypothetical protein CLM62_08005 [Streptomyces sp. SA15]
MPGRAHDPYVAHCGHIRSTTARSGNSRETMWSARIREQCSVAGSSAVLPAADQTLIGDASKGPNGTYGVSEPYVKTTSSMSALEPDHDHGHGRRDALAPRLRYTGAGGDAAARGIPQGAGTRGRCRAIRLTDAEVSRLDVLA